MISRRGQSVNQNSCFFRVIYEWNDIPAQSELVVMFLSLLKKNTWQIFVNDIVKGRGTECT